ncbi:MAG: alkaline phosphatase family protein [Bryobacterales bacterium]|nr:alkaline phosphatase family protein [Bryobacterales bacterium]
MKPLLSLAVLLCVAVRPAPAQRVLLISLDGFAYQALTQDEATRDMPALRALMARGVALPMQPAFPSTTANGHIALATGAWGGVNGKHANSHPLAPRSAHTSFERGNGFRAEGLTAEPLWVAAARQGVRAAAVNFVPTYPFLPVNAPGGLPLTLINQYQTRRIAPNRLLTGRDLTPEPCEHWQPPLEPSRAPRRCYTWSEAALAFHLAVGAARGGSYDHADIAVERGGARVRAWAEPLESSLPTERPLARHFSGGLSVGQHGEAVVYFRLFDAGGGGGSVALLRSAAEELAVFDERGETMRRRILDEVGGMVGNGSALGSPLDDVALRRTLELDELAIRQQARLQEWVWRNAAPRLQMGYLSYPDHSDHAWLGLASMGGVQFQRARAWIYTAIDRALAPLLSGLAPDDTAVLVSDHGMGPVTKHVHVYLPLERVGLVARDSGGKPHPARSKLSMIYNCAVVNTLDWKGGIVPVGEREAVITVARRTLESLLDPETGQRVIQGFYTSVEEKRQLGFGGPAGADFCLDPAPGYYLNHSFDGPVVRRLDTPTGQHGGYPLRTELRSIFVTAGPRARLWKGGPGLRAIDVAPYIAGLLGIAPPAQAGGGDPLQSQ